MEELEESVWSACDRKMYIGRRAMEMKVQGRRKKGRPKRRWLDKVNDDIKEKGSCWLMRYTNMLHGGECHRKSGNGAIQVLHNAVGGGC